MKEHRKVGGRWSQVRRRFSKLVRRAHIRGRIREMFGRMRLRNRGTIGGKRPQQGLGDQRNLGQRNLGQRNLGGQGRDLRADQRRGAKAGRVSGITPTRGGQGGGPRPNRPR